MNSGLYLVGFLFVFVLFQMCAFLVQVLSSNRIRVPENELGSLSFAHGLCSITDRRG